MDMGNEFSRFSIEKSQIIKLLNLVILYLKLHFNPSRFFHHHQTQHKNCK